MHHNQIEQVSLSPVGDHECAQIDGGISVEALASIGIEVMQEIFYCVMVSLVGLPCGG